MVQTSSQILPSSIIQKLQVLVSTSPSCIKHSSRMERSEQRNGIFKVDKSDHISKPFLVNRELQANQ